MEINQAQQNILLGTAKSCAGFSTSLEKMTYSDEEIVNITELGDILQGIRKRLISEGLSIDELRKKLV